MKKTSLLILLIIAGLSQIFIFCGKTDTDEEWEQNIKAFWVPVNAEYQIMVDMPSYLFLDDNRGASFYTSFELADSFNWEILRGQLKIYYDESPSYYYGYDKYNSRYLFRIKSFNDTIIDVVQYLNSGFQKDYYFLKSDLLDPDEDF
ncbi:MAG: hypothetical protein PHP52_06675 [Bacteroidales bacterium]|jgi:hypothetical protein|nr:hypothetical protein [Bacteroidales bacterium]MDD4217230.1 hypothetical protein [Bacteroidales bacterium]MDY0141067.1 hypothetical protein [Bacteroidales bacterium]